jgi:sulfate permease, SulP family
MIQSLRRARPRWTRQDATAGLVLGVQSVPDGLATGLLAGVNPMAGLYGYMVGTATGALLTSSAFMAVQGTGAMAMVVADVPAITGRGRPDRRVGHALHAHRCGDAGGRPVAAGCGAAIRVECGDGRVHQCRRGEHRARSAGEPDGLQRRRCQPGVRAINTIVRPGQLDAATLFVGVATMVLIVLFDRTRLGAMGLVVAVVITSAAARVAGWDSVATLARSGDRPRCAPTTRVAAAALGPVADRPGGVARVRRPRPGSGHLGELHEPRWLDAGRIP